MKYNRDAEFESLVLAYKEHPQADFMHLMVSKIVWTIHFLLSDLNTLALVEARRPLLKKVIHVLVKSIHVSSSDDFRRYYNEVNRNELMYEKNILFHMITLQWDNLGRLLHGSWSSIYRFLLRELEWKGQIFRKPLGFTEEVQSELVVLTHQISQAHLRDVILRLSRSHCFLDWTIHDDSKRIEITESIAQRFPSATHLILATYQVASGFFKKMEIKSGYRRTPALYMFLLQSLDLTRCASSLEFQAHFERICVYYQLKEDASRMIQSHIQDLRHARFGVLLSKETLNECSTQAPPETSWVVSQVLDAMSAQLSIEKEEAIMLMRKALTERLRACSRENPIQRKRYKVELKDFESRAKRGDYVFAPINYDTSAVSVSLFDKTNNIPLEESVDSEENVSQSSLRK